MNLNSSSTAGERSEGPIARAIENQTAKLPSDTFLWAAFGSIGISLLLRFSGRKHGALFVGQWAPTFLLLGIYNKLVKLHGSDRQDAASRNGPPVEHFIPEPLAPDGADQAPVSVER